jgi:hypothetical protein
LLLLLSHCCCCCCCCCLQAQLSGCQHGVAGQVPAGMAVHS